MPIWGVLAILSNFCWPCRAGADIEVFYLLSLADADPVRRFYNRLSKPINRLQTEAARTGGRLDNARELQASWDRSVMIRIPLLAVSLFAQCIALLTTSAVTPLTWT